jgi:SynChlorMet cassette protein ScmD
VKNDDKPIANPFVVLREEFDDWAVLFDPDTGRGFGLNPTGVYVWKLLDGERTIDGLLAETRRYDDSIPEEARDHIGAFVDALVGEGLVGDGIARFGLPNNRDRMALHPGKCSFSSLGHVSEVKPFIYEPPKVVDLNSKQVAHGCCLSGTSPASDCSDGGFLVTVCVGGACTVNFCQSGSNANHECNCGSIISNNYDYCGSGGCDSYSCQTGTSH